MTDIIPNLEEYEYPAWADTNEDKDTVQDRPGPYMPARVFIFWVIEEFGKDGIVVRGIYADPRAALEGLGREVFRRKPDQMQFEMYPEKYGLRVRGPAYLDDIFAAGRHATGYLPHHQSPFLSGSTNFPGGSPQHVATGRPVYVDINRLLASGGIRSSTESSTVS